MKDKKFLQKFWKFLKWFAKMGGSQNVRGITELLRNPKFQNVKTTKCQIQNGGILNLKIS